MLPPAVFLQLQQQQATPQQQQQPPSVFLQQQQPPRFSLPWVRPMAVPPDAPRPSAAPAPKAFAVKSAPRAQTICATEASRQAPQAARPCPPGKPGRQAPQAARPMAKATAPPRASAATLAGVADKLAPRLSRRAAAAASRLGLSTRPNSLGEFAQIRWELGMHRRQLLRHWRTWQKEYRVGRMGVGTTPFKGAGTLLYAAGFGPAAPFLDATMHGRIWRLEAPRKSAT